MVKQPALYLVGTPIGNLSDISPRVARTLESVDLIAAEDTRNTLKLLNHLGIKKPMISYFEHNKRQRGEEILARIRAGDTVALVTDAGMPAVSDPGEDLVRLVVQNGYEVTAVAGPCALICGLILSGLPTGRFCFEGFLSVNKKSRAEHLDALKNETRTMIFYESPQKLCRTLADLCGAFGGDRPAALIREISKLHEETCRGTLAELAARQEETPPRGEYVVVVGGRQTPVTEETFWQTMTLRQHVDHYRALGMPKNDAIKAAAKDRGAKKSDVYAEYVKAENV